MSSIKIPNDEIKTLLGAEPLDLPKYSTQLFNLANQNAQGTRPAVVGQMSDLIQEFSGQTLEEWKKWYLERHPDAIENATRKIKEMIENFRKVLDVITDEMMEEWVKDLVIVKTFIGLKFQEAILSKIATSFSTTYTLAEPEEESKGIDGYIGGDPVSIKPETYKTKKTLREEIQVPIIFYEKQKDGLRIDVSEIVGKPII
jgi:hypothetical protein